MAQDADNKPKIDFGGKHLIIEPKEKHTATVIWLHGLGDTGAGWHPAMIPISKKYPFIRFVLPTAPSLKITMNGGMSMPGWHDIESLQNLMKNTFKYKEDSFKIITNLLDNELTLLSKNLNITNESLINNRIIIGGFSQGAAMAMYTGLCYDKCKLSGLISLSGYLCDFKLFEKFSKKQYPNINLLMYHGIQDMIVQTVFGKMSFEYLKNVCQLKNIEFKTANVPQYMNFGHGTTEQEMADVSNYIGKWLPKEFEIEKEKEKEKEKDNTNQNINEQKEDIADDNQQTKSNTK